MAITRFPLDAGGEGAALSTGNSGLSLLVLGANSTAQYRASAAVRGAYGARFTGADTEQAYGQVNVTSHADQVCLVAFVVSAATMPPTGAVGTIARYRNASAQALIVVLSSNGKVQVQNRSGVTISGMILNDNTALPYGNYWLQLEVQVNTTTGTASSVQARLLNSDGTARGSAASSSGNVDTGTAALTIFQFGKTASAGLVVSEIDEVAVDSATTTAIPLPVSADPNTAPTANAGADVTVFPWTTVPLDGAGSDLESGVTALWDVTSANAAKVAIASPTSLVTTAVFSPTTVEEETFTLRLRVTDAGGLVGTDTKTVTVRKADISTRRAGATADIPVRILGYKP